MQVEDFGIGGCQTGLLRLRLPAPSLPVMSRMKYLFFLAAGLFVVFSSPLRAAESYLVMEAHSGKVLLAANPEQKRPVASLTKIVTAKVVLDWAKVSQTSLSAMASVPPDALAFGGANPMRLRPGDRIALRDALYSTLLGSDNIAAYVLADHVGRSLLAQRRRGGDPQRAFVAEMNTLARALGMRRTRFATPHGLDLPGKRAYSTASDMARMCVHVMRDAGFAFYVKQKSRTIRVVGQDGSRRSFRVGNTNALDQWAAAGFPVSAKRRELIVVPRLR